MHEEEGDEESAEDEDDDNDDTPHYNEQHLDHEIEREQHNLNTTEQNNTEQATQSGSIPGTRAPIMLRSEDIASASLTSWKRMKVAAEMWLQRKYGVKSKMARLQHLVNSCITEWDRTWREAAETRGRRKNQGKGVVSEDRGGVVYAIITLRAELYIGSSLNPRKRCYQHGKASFLPRTSPKKQKIHTCLQRSRWLMLPLFVFKDIFAARVGEVKLIKALKNLGSLRNCTKYDRDAETFSTNQGGKKKRRRRPHRQEREKGNIEKSVLATEKETRRERIRHMTWFEYKKYAEIRKGQVYSSHIALVKYLTIPGAKLLYRRFEEIRGEEQFPILRLVRTARRFVLKSQISKVLEHCRKHGNCRGVPTFSSMMMMTRHPEEAKHIRGYW